MIRFDRGTNFLDLPPIAHAASQQESSALGGQASAAWTKVTLGFAIWSCIDLQEAFSSQATLKMEGKILSGLPRIEGKTTQRDTWVHVIETNGDTWKMGASWLCSFSNFLPLYIKGLSRALIPFPAPKDERTEIINQRGVTCIQCSISEFQFESLPPILTSNLNCNCHGLLDCFSTPSHTEQKVLWIGIIVLIGNSTPGADFPLACLLKKLILTFSLRAVWSATIAHMPSLAQWFFKDIHIPPLFNPPSIFWAAKEMQVGIAWSQVNWFDLGCNLCLVMVILTT